jgi:hypothetical protein
MIARPCVQCSNHSIVITISNMDIDDKQDEILDYEDGEAPMGTDTVDADIILVDEAEGDAEMVDDAEVVKQGQFEVFSPVF